MKIGICVRTWGEKGGIGVYTRSVVQELVNLDQRNSYFLFYQDPYHMGTFENYENVCELHVKGRNKWMWDQWSVPRLGNRIAVDIIFHTKFSIPFMAKCNTAMVLHGTERFVHPEFHQQADLLYFKTIYPYYLKRASLILAVSEKARQDIIKFLKIDPDKIKTVHLAANPVFRPIQDEEVLIGLTQKYNLPKKFIIWVGHVYPGKNVGRLIKAFSRVRKQADIDLVLVGSKRWKYENDLSYIDKLGLAANVHLLGHVSHENLVGIYNLAELMVFPSFYESFGIPILEAMACGCPVVTSGTGGTTESGGDAALYVYPLNENMIAEAILKVLADNTLKKELVQKGFKNVKRFSWQKTAKKTLHAIESVSN